MAYPEYVSRERIAELAEIFHEHIGAFEGSTSAEINLSLKTIVDVRDVLWNIAMPDQGVLIIK